MTIVATRILMLLAVLLIPGAGIGMAVAWALRKLRLKRPRALPLRAVDGSELYTWADWHRDARYDHPIRYFLTETLTDRVSAIRWRAHDVYQKFVSLHWRKDHLLDIRGPGYVWGKLEPGERLLYATFAAFIDFVQGEGSWILEITEPEAEVLPEDEHLMPAAIQVRVLYHWWLDTRPRVMAEIAALPGGEDRYDRTQWAYQADQVMLRLLLDSRSAML